MSETELEDAEIEDRLLMLEMICLMAWPNDAQRQCDFKLYLNAHLRDKATNGQGEQKRSPEYLSFLDELI